MWVGQGGRQSIYWSPSVFWNPGSVRSDLSLQSFSAEGFPTAVLHEDVCGKTLGAWWLCHCSTHWTEMAKKSHECQEETVLRKGIEIILGYVGMESLPPSPGSGILLLLQVWGSDMCVLVTYRLSWSSVRKSFGKNVNAFTVPEQKSIILDWMGCGEVSEEQSLGACFLPLESVLWVGRWHTCRSVAVTKIMA